MKWWYLFKERTTFLCESECVRKLHYRTIRHLNCAVIFVPPKNMTVGQTSSVLKIFSVVLRMATSSGVGSMPGRSPFLALSSTVDEPGRFGHLESTFCALRASVGAKNVRGRDTRSRCDLNGI